MVAQLQSGPAVVEKQLVDIDLNGGVNERDRPECLDWTKYLTTAENVVMNQQKALVKRSGLQVYNSTSDNGSYTYVTRVIPLTDGIGFIGRGSLGSTATFYHLDESTGDIRKKNEAPELAVMSVSTVATVSLSSNGASVGAVCATAANSNYKVILYKVADTNPATFAVVVVDRQSNNVVRRYVHTSGAGAGNSTACAAVVADRYLHMAISNGVNRPYMVFVDLGSLPSSGILNAGPNLTSTAGGELVIAVCPGNTYSTVISGTAANTFFEKFNTAGTSTANSTAAIGLQVQSADSDGTITSDPALYVVSYISAVPRYVLKFYNSSFTNTRTVTDTTATSVAVANTTRVALAAGGETRTCVFRKVTTAAIDHPRVDIFSCSAAATTFTYVSTADDWAEYSAPFYASKTARFYVALGKLMVANSGASASSDTVTSGIYLVDITGAIGANAVIPAAANLLQLRAVASICNYTAKYVQFVTDGTVQLQQQPPRFPIADAGFRLFTTYPYLSTSQSLGYETAELMFFNPAGYSGAADVIGASKLCTYDGNAVQDIGFLDSPSCFVTAAGGAIAAGTYNYVVVHEYRDLQGRSHYSRTSRVASITFAAASTVTVASNFPIVCDHDSFVYDGTNASRNIVTKIYRTISGGTQYFYIGSIVPGTTFSDTLSDATISANPMLFRQPGTQGTALDRYAPLMCKHVIRHKDRVFYCRGQNVYYSGFAVDGEAPWFNPAFSITVPGGNGEITALASMDGTLVVFKSDSVFLIDGDGPPENGGTGTEFSPPRRILTEHGCVDQRTLVSTPDGLMYRSGVGIMLLDRSAHVKFVGQMVQSTVGANPGVGGACYDPQTGRAFFIMSATTGADGSISDGDSTTIAVFDFYMSAWTTFSAYTGSVTTGNRGIGDIANGQVTIASQGGSKRRTMVGGRYLYVLADSYSSLDTMVDGSSNNYVPLKLETGWIKSTLQERIRLSDILFLAKKSTNHNIKISVAYDYNTAYVDSKTWTPADINGLGIEQLERQIAQQAHMAFRVKIEDSVPADTATYPVTTGNGPEILAITARIGVRGGGAKVAAGQKG